MKLVIDMTGFWPGGAERQVLDLGNGLMARGHDVMLLLHQRALAYQGELSSSGMAIVELHRMSGYDARVTLDVYRAIRAFHAHLCLCELYSPWGRLAALLAGCPVVVAEHSSDRPLRQRILWANRFFRPTTAGVVACAEAQVPGLLREGHLSDRITVIQNGVDTHKFTHDAEAGRAFRSAQRLPADGFVIGIVAAQRPEKRHDRFIKLIEQLRDAGVAAWGCAVGSGPLLDKNTQTASLSPARDFLRFPGGCESPVAAYSAFDVVVLVSDAVETFPLSLLEAQACEVPVVAMDIGGVREALLDGMTGEVIAQDDIQGMAESLARLAASPEARRTMGATGKQWVTRHHDVERMIDEYEGLLTSLAR